MHTCGPGVRHIASDRVGVRRVHVPVRLSSVHTIRVWHVVGVCGRVCVRQVRTASNSTPDTRHNRVIFVFVSPYHFRHESAKTVMTVIQCTCTLHEFMCGPRMSMHLVWGLFRGLLMVENCPNFLQVLGIHWGMLDKILAEFQSPIGEIRSFKKRIIFEVVITI